MKLLNNKNYLRKGFTLIELLVVIAVLGVLAAAVVAAINPIGKINAAKDSNIKSDISQISGAMQAYYTAQAGAGTPTYPVSVVALVPGELKTEPKTPAGASYLIVKLPAACDAGATPCTAIAVYAQSNVTTTNYICWDSTNNVIKTSGAVPVAATATCAP